MSSSPKSSPAPGADRLHASLVQEVRYPLPQLLDELQLDRSSGHFAQEKLSQVEIGALFDSPTKRRVKKRRL